jgi:hypothetical protein
MDDLSIFISIVFLLIISVIGIIRAETIAGIFMVFLLLTFTSYTTIYLFNV